MRYADQVECSSSDESIESVLNVRLTISLFEKTVNFFFLMIIITFVYNYFYFISFI